MSQPSRPWTEVVDWVRAHQRAVAVGLVAAGVHIGTRHLPVAGPLPHQGRVWLSSDGATFRFRPND